MVLAPPVLIERSAAASKLADAAIAVAVCSLFLLAPAGAAAAADLGRTIALKPGEEATFDAKIANGSVTLGPPHLSKPSTEQPKEGQISVSFVRRGLAPYGDLTAVERTFVPVDFVATGLIGNIKIDEVVICGRLDAPVLSRIAAGSWRVSLNRFFVHQNDQATAEGDLGCPK